jgi:putative hemolysin
MFLTVWSSSVIFSVFAIIVLTILSGLVSGSEVAFFSMGPADLKDLKEEKSVVNGYLLKLLETPQRLLATILISNNIVNILIIIVSDYVLSQVIPESVFGSWGESIATYLPVNPSTTANVISFLITVLGVTFLLVLFGELLPKIYANVQHLPLAKRMARPMHWLYIILHPFTGRMVNWSHRMEKRLAQANSQDSSKKEDLENAIAFSVDQDIYKTDEADLLKGIINFGEVSVKQVMRARMDIVGVDLQHTYKQMMDIVLTSGYSRLPVYSDNLDDIKGILYVKDLLNHTREASDFEWQQLTRNTVLYVPETKKIDELLKEFQVKRLHLAIAVDEFGGTSGLVTLEDIMEEIIGEIKDEFDEDEELEYIRIDDNTFVFDAKILLNDACRIMDIDLDEFDRVKGESDSLAGLILEVHGAMPKKSQLITFENYSFQIKDVSPRRIKEVKVIIDRQAQS